MKRSLFVISVFAACIISSLCACAILPSGENEYDIGFEEGFEEGQSSRIDDYEDYIDRLFSDISAYEERISELEGKIESYKEELMHFEDVIFYYEMLCDEHGHLTYEQQY